MLIVSLLLFVEHVALAENDLSDIRPTQVRVGKREYRFRPWIKEMWHNKMLQRWVRFAEVSEFRPIFFGNDDSHPPSQPN